MNKYLYIEIQCAGEVGGNYVRIIVNKDQIEFGANENGSYNGFYIVVISPNGHVL